MIKIKFDSKLSSDQDGALPFGLIRIYRSRSKFVVSFHPWKMLAVLAFVAVTGYIVAVAALYSVRAQRPHNQIEVADIALPWNWSSISEKAGQTNLAHGKAMFEAKNYGAALHMIRAGLKRAPNDHEARLMLAQIYHGAGVSDAATNILGQGLNYGYPNDDAYIKLLLILLAMRENYSEIADIADKLRSFPEIQDNRERWSQVAEMQLNALKKERDFERMLNFTREMQREFPNDTEYRDLETLSLIKLGFIDEAVTMLAAYPLARKHSPQFWYLQSMLGIELDDAELIDEASNRVMNWPTNPHTLQAQLITELAYADLIARRDAALDQYLERYANSAEPLQLALKFFSDQFSVEQTDAIIEKVTKLKGGKPPRIDIYAVQARLLAGDGESAGDLLEQMLAEEGMAESAEKLDWMKQLVKVVNEQAQNDRKAFWDYSRNERLPAEAYITSARALLVADDRETALRISENGLHYYPFNEDLAELRNEASQLL